MSKSRKYTDEENKFLDAVIRNDTDTIAEMCEANTNLMPAVKDIVLFIAARTQGIEENTIGTLAEFGANFIAQFPEHKSTCLHLAAANNPEYIRDILGIYYGELLDRQNLDERTAKKKVAEFVNMRDKNGSSVVQQVIGFSDEKVELRKLLLENGGDINAQDKDGETIGHICVQQVKEICKEKKHDSKQTEYSCFSVIEKLVKEGLDPTIKDRKGKTVLDSIGKEYKVRIKAIQEGNIPDLSQLSMTEKMEARKVSAKTNIRQ